MNNSRRTFIKQACGLCATVAGIGLVLPSLNSCATIPAIKTNVEKGDILVPLSAFGEENNLVIIKNAPNEFDFVAVKYPDGSYKAFELQCTHQPNPLVPTKTGFYCNAHGSAFSLDGKVKKEPALREMKLFPTKIENNQLVINIL